MKKPEVKELERNTTDRESFISIKKIKKEIHLY